MKEINIVQGFRGRITYLLSQDGIDIDLSNATSIYFNFMNQREDIKHSIRCKQGSLTNEVSILFGDESAHDGVYFCEFIVRNGSNVDIYPIVDYIKMNIRRRVQI